MFCTPVPQHPVYGHRMFYTRSELLRVLYACATILEHLDVRDFRTGSRSFRKL